jgi:hypothetical protein
MPHDLQHIERVLLLQLLLQAARRLCIRAAKTAAIQLEQSERRRSTYVRQPEFFSVSAS